MTYGQESPLYRDMLVASKKRDGQTWADALQSSLSARIEVHSAAAAAAAWSRINQWFMVRPDASRCMQLSSVCCISTSVPAPPEAPQQPPVPYARRHGVRLTLACPCPSPLNSILVQQFEAAVVGHITQQQEVYPWKDSASCETLQVENLSL